MENVCPYCGWEDVQIVGSPYRGIGRGRCPNCQSNGPEVSPPSAAIAAFCHPAHLRTYDPAIHVVVSRDRLTHYADVLDSLPVTTLTVLQIAAELRAALEVRE